MRVPDHHLLSVAGFLKGYLYTVAGFDIYASWLIVAIIVAFCIMLINIVGAKTAAKLQTILTIIIGGAGILLIVASVINGTVDNLDGQMFAEVGGGGIVKSILSVAVISPFYLIGFDVIPQAAEEINVPPKKIGGMLILSVVLAVLFYAFVIIAVGLVMNSGAITASQTGTGSGHGGRDGARLQDLGHGEGHHRRRHVRHHHLVELVHDRRLARHLLDG